MRKSCFDDFRLDHFVNEEKMVCIEQTDLKLSNYLVGGLRMVGGCESGFMNYTQL
jgi:hypothetical protein